MRRCNIPHRKRMAIARAVAVLTEPMEPRVLLSGVTIPTLAGQSESITVNVPNANEPLSLPFGIDGVPYQQNVTVNAPGGGNPLATPADDTGDNFSATSQ